MKANTTNKQPTTIASTFWSAAVAALLVTAVQSSAAQRPLADFLSRQGSSAIFIPPSPDYIGWTQPSAGLSISMDYAGLADAYLGGILGTVVEGIVNERPLADGTAEVQVLIRARNALTFAMRAGAFDPSGNPIYDFATDPLLFGVRADDVAGGATPSLGECEFLVIFINSAPGAPLPDLIDYLTGARDILDVKLFSFRGRANGTLADGSPGRVEVVQTGLFGAALKAEFRGALADGFPAERIIIRQTGK